MDGERITPITMTIAQAAEYVGVSTKTIRRAAEDDRLTAVRLGRSTALRTTPEWIAEWIATSKRAGKPQDAPTDKRGGPRRPARGKPARGELKP